MKVILLADIKGVGKKGDVKDLKEGYVRNLLLPRHLVEMGTPEALKKKAKLDEEYKKKKDALRGVLNKKAAEIKSLVLNFSKKFGEKGESFGSVSKHEIEDALKAKGFEGEVILERNIKNKGIHSVGVDLGEGVRTEVQVVLSPED